MLFSVYRFTRYVYQGKDRQQKNSCQTEKTDVYYDTEKNINFNLEIPTDQIFS